MRTVMGVMAVMTMRRKRSEWRERGSLSIFVALTVVSLLAVVGLVIDGAGRLRAVENADALAQEAARAAGQQVDQAAALRGEGVRVQPDEARAAALSYLAASGVQGTAVSDGQSVQVTVDSVYHTTLLGLVGIGDLPVQGRGSAVLRTGTN